MSPEATDALLRGIPRWQHPGLRLLFAVGARPRGMALLARLRPLDQAALALLALAHYDDPVVAGRLGWDADAVVARGRALRESEGRP